MWPLQSENLMIFTTFQDSGVRGTTDNNGQLDMIKKLGFEN